MLSISLAVLLLLAVVISCKKEFTTLHTGDSPGETLLASNIEKPGTDCKVSAQKHLQTNLEYVSKFFLHTNISNCVFFFSFKIPDNILAVSTDKNVDPSDWQSQYDGMQQGQLSTKVGTGTFPRSTKLSFCHTYFGEDIACKN